MILESPLSPTSINHPDYDKRTVKRLLSSIKKEGDCWIWTKHIMWKGYGTMRYKNVKKRAHRLSYMLIGKKSLTPGLVLDHLCENRSCINPNHLEEVTNEENLRRGRIRLNN